MKLNIGGIWANALWWNKLGPNADATNFLWDFDFQLDDASSTAAQALEFDAFQFLGGYNYMMGSQCNYASGYWDLWDAQSGQWQRSSTTCPMFQPGVWHHIQWFVQRAAGTTNYTFVTLTVDGVVYQMNQSYSARERRLGRRSRSAISTGRQCKRTALL